MRRAFVLVVVAAVAAVCVARPWDRASRETAAQPAIPRRALIAAVQGQQRGPHAIDQATVLGKGLFLEADGQALTVGQGQTQDHHNTCVVAAGADSAGIACDPTPFADAPVQLVESFSAGPGGKPFRKWQVSGLALPSVKRIELLDSAGKRHTVTLSQGGAFFFQFPRAELARGVTGISLLVYRSDGGLIKEVTL
jgi:hypothetical protein